MVDVNSNDTKSSLDSAYLAATWGGGGVVLLDPFILSSVANSNANALEELFTNFSGDPANNIRAGSNVGTGGISWVISPDRSYTFAWYDAADMDAAIQTTLDNRPAIPVKPSVSNNRSSLKVISYDGSRIDFAVPQSGDYEVSFFSAAGRLVSMRHVACQAGKNAVDISEMAHGSYIVKISGSSGTTSRVCPFISRQ